MVQIVIFGNDVILNKPIKDWPTCDVLISFHSQGFPLSKARDYVHLRNPFVLNDVDKQFWLLDRRIVYRTLSENGILVPRYRLPH